MSSNMNRPFIRSLRELRQVVLPHLGSATLATRVRMGMICLENIAAVVAGKAGAEIRSTLITTFYAVTLETGEDW